MSTVYDTAAPDVNIAPGDTMPSVIPQDERARLDAFIATAARRKRLTRIGAELIPATPLSTPGPVRWFRLDGARSPRAWRPLTAQACGEGDSLVFRGVPYEFGADMQAILSRYYGGRWHVSVSHHNARRIAAWLAWWEILTDEPALELLRAWAVVNGEVRS